MKPTVIAIVLLMAVACACVDVNAAQWTTGSNANGHDYEVIVVPGGISWSDANAAAIARGGYLATITSAEENTFVGTLVSNSAYWTHPGDWYGPWLGGYQTPVPAPSNSANWNWVTGEPWGFTAWDGFEPNNAGSNEEDRLFYSASFLSLGAGSSWGDKIDGGPANLQPVAYVVETVPEPSTWILMSVALVCSLLLGGRSSRRRA